MRASDEPAVIELTLDELRPGDIVFTARPSPLQRLVQLAGDPWRHVGLAVDHKGDLCSCEVIGHRFQLRSIRETLPRQSRIGVVRLGVDRRRCTAAAVGWARQMVASPNVYAWDDLILTGVLLAVRRRMPAALLDEAMAVIASAAELASVHPIGPDTVSYTCSSFVHRAFDQAGFGCELEVVVEPVRTSAGRERGPSRIQLPGDPFAGVDHADLQDLLDRYSLLELATAELQGDGRPLERHSASSNMSPAQMLGLTWKLVRIFAGVRSTIVPDRLVLDGRWVSPGDLWRLPGVELRGIIPGGLSGGL